ncbi:MAG: DUF5688 family protein [Lachnospiraceae bacterium]
MNYHEFLNYIKENITSYLLQYEKSENQSVETEGFDDEPEQSNPQYMIEVHQVFKNNGIKLDGLTIRKSNENICPNIYLNSYFEMYQMGKPISVIMDDIVKQYFGIQRQNNISVLDLRDFAAVRCRIIIRLVNYEKNREVLKDCPYRRFLDLAVTYRYMANNDETGLASSMIRNEEFSCWDISEEELYQLALFNTMREFPWHMEPLTKIILDCLKRNLSEDDYNEMELEELEKAKDHVNMYVLSNDASLNGATCILYDSVIRNFAKVQGTNIVILPSSIHEVILVPEQEDTDMEFLQNLVIEANQSAVGLIDLLSDSIYYYQLDKDEMKIYSKTSSCI